MNGRELTLFLENELINKGLSTAELKAVARLVGAAAVFVDSTEPIIDLSDDATYVELEASVKTLKVLIDPDYRAAEDYLKSIKTRNVAPGITHTHKDYQDHEHG